MGQVENNSTVTKTKSSQSFDWEDFFLPSAESVFLILRDRARNFLAIGCRGNRHVLWL